MSQSVQMPALGESVTEGTVTRWLKKVGDRVEVDEPLLEVSTDKVDTEIPSPRRRRAGEDPRRRGRDRRGRRDLARIGDGRWVRRRGDGGAPTAATPGPADAEPEVAGRPRSARRPR